MKLSIIVPVYNVEPYLQACLESISNQKYSDFECIVVDDGSTDNSRDICEDYVLKDSRFHDKYSLLLEDFLNKEKIPMLKKLEYETYIKSYKLARLIHARKI